MNSHRESHPAIEILLVDDSPTDRLLTTEAFQDSKISNSLNSVENGVECLAYLRRDGQYHSARRPDLILLDLNMPKKDGREVLAELKSDPDLKFIPVIVLTTSAAEDDIMRAYGDHANSYITKPVDFQRFSEAISALGVYWMEHVTLPVATAGTAASISPGPRTAQGDIALRVLVIEDNPVDVLFLREALSEWKTGTFTVHHISRVAQLRECLEENDFDIIITDLGLPDSRGLSTYRQVKARAGSLPVIVLTGDEDEEVGMQTLHEGAKECLVKGQLTGGGLARAIRYAVDKSEIEEQLRQSQRMESLGRLAGGIAHDFNNLLMIIDSHAGFVSEGGLSPGEVSHSLAEIKQAAQRAASLTRQLLTFSRRQVMQLRPLDLNLVVGNFGQVLQRILGEEIEVRIELTRQPLQIMGDTGMIEQILMNLAVNSRDAMPSGGKLTIATGLEDRRVPSVSPQEEAREGLVATVSVSDTGSGIAPEIASQIFDPFFTTKDVGKGTGLGLATVHTILQQHGGWVEVSSEESLGTIFRLYLPLRSDVEPVVQENVADGPSTGVAPRTVMLVDDEHALRRMVSRFLSKRYKILEADSGAQALQVWDENRGEIDLLITDMVMPGGMTGHQLALELKARKPELKVLYTSGYSFDFSDQHLHLEEGVNFLQKPYAIATARQLIDSIIAR